MRKGEITIDWVTQQLRSQATVRSWQMCQCSVLVDTYLEAQFHGILERYQHCMPIAVKGKGGRRVPTVCQRQKNGCLMSAGASTAAENLQVVGTIAVTVGCQPLVPMLLEQFGLLNVSSSSQTKSFVECQ